MSLYEQYISIIISLPFLSTHKTNSPNLKKKKKAGDKTSAIQVECQIYIAKSTWVRFFYCMRVKQFDYPDRFSCICNNTMSTSHEFKQLAHLIHKKIMHITYLETVKVLFSTSTSLLLCAANSPVGSMTDSDSDWAEP